MNKLKLYDLRQLDKVYVKAMDDMDKHQKKQKKNLEEFNRNVIKREIERNQVNYEIGKQKIHNNHQIPLNK